MLKATHKEHEQIVGRQKVKLNPGQFIYGRKQAAEELNLAETTVRDYMKLLEIDGTLTIKSTNKYSIITIVKWEFYQGNEEDYDNKTNNKSTSDHTANEQQMDTNKNGKNGEEVKEQIASFRSFYSDEQLKVIDKYFDVITETRKTKKLSHSVVKSEMEYWSKFDRELVINSLEIHIEKYPKMKEEYTRGIIRNAKPEDLQKVVKMPEKPRSIASYKAGQIHKTKWGLLMN
jgi:hypothetical protein